MGISKSEKKCTKRQIKYTHLLLKETGICGSDKPTQFLMLGNAGLVTGLKREQLLELCLPYGPIDNIIMLPGKSYCFIVYHDVSSAIQAYDAIHGKADIPAIDSGLFYFIYTEKVPTNVHEFNSSIKPPGLIIIENFITPDEEDSLLKCVNWQEIDHSQSLKHRRVTHYGYEFRYDTNNVDKNCPLAQGIPTECTFLLSRIKERGIELDIPIPDQLTVNQYQPGQGIPPHIDTHSAFDDPIMSLSLGSGVVMDFKHTDGHSYSVMLPRQSLIIMAEESRYSWTHGITPRKRDVVPTPGGGLSVQDRGLRTSFTFRHVRRGDCDCAHELHCDSRRRQVRTEAEDAADDAARLEAMHVHRVYEEIAGHFSDTRHKPWPNVVEFVQGLAVGDVLVDVGCGNGKYFGIHEGIFELGCDRSVGLAQVCKNRGFQIFNCNCLSLPLNSGSADGCISIAVIHHLASKERRLQAIEEIVRILRPGGKALIYVWAKDQERHKTKSTYLKQDRKNRRATPADGDTTSTVDTNSTHSIENISLLPVHTNRTQFQHQDILVPWKVKPTRNEGNAHKEVVGNTPGCETPTFLRYYHVFEEEELENLCSLIKNAKVVKSFYDQGNWCVVIEKIN